MKSGIVTRRDPYLMDPSILVDPNQILDYGSSFKDETHNYNTQDPLMELINCNDTQLENIILNSGLCGECDNPWAENEFDLDELLKELGLGKVESCSVKNELDVSTCTVNEAATSEVNDIANYEEVYTCSLDGSESFESESCNGDHSESDNNVDTESVDSFVTESSASTLKRKLKDTVSDVQKRRKTNRGSARRTKRVQDERVKNQNKVAAMKYRKKKRDEKCYLDDILQDEEEKNKKLKASVEELKVNIDVLKELLGKYLSPNQLKFST